MRIVLINQFYPPDVAPTGCYLHDLACALVASGHEVSVLASQHAYAGGSRFRAHERLDGVEVIRLAGFSFGRSTYAGKLADYAAYYARVLLKVFRYRHVDLVVALTTPPFVGVLAKLLAEQSGARHAHWVMDVYPDVLGAHRLLHNLPLTALTRIAKHSLAGAHSAVALGPAMANRVRAYAAPGTAVEWVPLWSPQGLSPWPHGAEIPLRAERSWTLDRTTLLYSGNFGLGHRFDEFLAAAQHLGPSGPRWAFAGSGRARPQVERFALAHPALPLQLLPYVDEDQLREHLCSADVHLISMDSRWEGMILPSKLQASFAVAKPVIFVGRETQDMARWILESGSGWVVAEGDVTALLDAIRAAGDATERMRRGELGHRYAQQHFQKAHNVQRLAALLGAA